MRVPEKIEARRVRLRRHRMDDLSAFASFLTHPTATRYMAFTGEQKSLEGARQMLEFVIASYETDQPIFSMTVADVDSDCYLGSTGLQPLADGDGLELYYTILPAHQRKGLATEAVRALIDFVFENTDFSRFVADVVPENIASVKVAENLGFVDTGPIRREARAGELSHQSQIGRRYVVTRPARSSS